MEKEPNLPSSMIDPQKIADAILDASINPARDVKVGTMAYVNTFVSKNLPSIGDRMSAKQVPNFQRDEPPRDPTTSKIPATIP